MRLWENCKTLPIVAHPTRPSPLRFIPATQKPFLSCSNSTDTQGVSRRDSCEAASEALTTTPGLMTFGAQAQLHCLAPRSSDRGKLGSSRPTPPALASGIRTNLHPGRVLAA